ncbi:energy-coupling factor ABC transporter ATP-binding protein [Lactiplantibacillus mudanjiangensis]|uniref:Cobalt ABC transporter [Lactobacillus sp.] n=1 Tax=Lactiplantibacillus mudanjiangensis TaxID=1296538 RepID=A0A660DU16_9LACO|nr:ABC transporter ATP-binding protein [Lactiplantibacillus mudanjiangensis]VDG20982.1 cobalt ABC transporter [Lactobacillus sp.] [Lactiplantibacillus mudanjiangensis]VDG22765.1 cobalt ABC transporter [Lactobacillus sp.] [Lactiplantibacillus mudanjiangensis]VDG26667.1 cobalt ABC transporter [Lactobacillus sp.] [Lactiplantibacillus mudanjiangensis]
MALIDLTDLSYDYPNTCGLASLSLTINPGEFVCLMGPNGSGKSTLLRLLSGLATATQGTYRFNQQLIDSGYLADAVKRQQLHQQIGMVFQNTDVQLFNPTVAEEVAFGPQQLGLSPSEVTKRVNDCLALTRSADLRDRVPYQLSGGEKKRVALASVLALNPQVLLLDEPLNGLTIAAQQQMLTLLQQLQAAGKTIIMASHNFQQVQPVGQRFLIFNADHHVTADVTASELATQPDLQAQLMTL